MLKRGLSLPFFNRLYCFLTFLIALTGRLDALSGDFVEYAHSDNSRELRAWIPDSAVAVRGILIIGNPSNSNGEGDSRAKVYDVAFQSFAARHGFALMGTKNFLNFEFGAGSGTSNIDWDALSAGINSISSQSGHPELANAPFIPTGFSNGGQFAYGLMHTAPDRTIAFCANKGGYYVAGGSNPPLSVPGIMIVGELDSSTRRNNLLAVYNAGRSQGAPWAWLEENRLGHQPGNADALLFNFYEEVLQMRYPAHLAPTATTQPQLLPYDDSDAYLVDLSEADWESGLSTIYRKADFVGDPLTHGEVPNLEVAMLYQAVASYDPNMPLSGWTTNQKVMRTDFPEEPLSAYGYQAAFNPNESFPYHLTIEPSLTDWTLVEIYDGDQLLTSRGNTGSQQVQIEVTPNAADGVCGLHAVLTLADSSKRTSDVALLIPNAEDTILKPGNLQSPDVAAGATLSGRDVNFQWTAPANRSNLGYSYSLDGIPDTNTESNAGSASYNGLHNGNYTFRVRARGDNGIWSSYATFSFIVNESGPEIAVRQGSTAVDDGGISSVSGTVAGENSLLTYTIESGGADPLNIGSPISLSGTDSAISLTTPPASSVAPAGSTLLELSVTPTVVGPWTATVSIPNNDIDEGPFDFTISGTAAAPNLDLEAPTGVSATATSEASVNLSWTNNASEAESLVIERREVYDLNTYETILDSVDAGVNGSGVEASGFWTMGWLEGHYGGSTAISNASDSANGYVRYTPDLSGEAGRYEVYIWDNPHGDCTNVPVTVTESGVTTTVIMDQTQAPQNGAWYKLGDFDLQDTDFVEVSNGFAPNPAGASQTVTADAVRFFRPVSGSPWSVVASLSDTNVSTFTDETLSPATIYEYRIRAVSTYVGGDWSPHTAVTTFSGPPLAPVADFQIVNTSTSQISLSWTPTGENAADYVIERRRTVTGDTYTIDNDDLSSVQVTGSWSSSVTVPGYYGAEYVHDGKANLGGKAFTYLPDVADPGVYDLYLWYSSNSARATNVPVTIVHRGGSDTVIVDQTANGGAWFKIASHALDSNSSVEIRNTATDGYVTADGFRCILTDEWMPLATIANTGTSSYTDSEVIANHDYEYRIRVVKEDASNLSDWSSLSASSSDHSYSDWISEQTWDGGDSSDAADPDGDGHSNQIEYALMMNPTSADEPYRAVGQSASGSFFIEFDRRSNTSDVEIRVRTSPSLSSWSTFKTYPAGVNPQADAETEIIETGSDYQRLRVLLPMDAEQNFVRIEVVSP